MANRWDRTLLCSVPVLLTPATRDRIGNITDKNFLLFFYYSLYLHLQYFFSFFESLHPLSWGNSACTIALLFPAAEMFPGERQRDEGDICFQCYGNIIMCLVFSIFLCKYLSVNFLVRKACILNICFLSKLRFFSYFIINPSKVGSMINLWWNLLKFICV